MIVQNPPVLAVVERAGQPRVVLELAVGEIVQRCCRNQVALEMLSPVNRCSFK